MTAASTTTRDQQREETRERIVAAALEAFAEKGFRGASTRDIARRAGTNQGLITYHFRSKDELWRAAIDRVFATLGTHLLDTATAGQEDPREALREGIRQYVRFNAAHPELFRLMVDEGKSSDERMTWLIDTHMRPRFEAIERRLEADGRIDPALLPHAFYAMVGAGSLIFAVAPECRRLTGLDPETRSAIETHAEFVARLLVP